MELMPKLRSAADGGLDPADAEAQDLIRTYRRLLQAFTGGDAGIQDSLNRMYQEDPEVAAQHGWVLDERMQTFLEAAMEYSLRE